MDSIKKVDFLRSYYRANTASSGSEVVRELKEIKNELRVANNMRADDVTPTNATGSPYLNDQTFQLQNVLFNSPRETEWKEVPSYEQTRENALVFRNLKKLNVL